MSTSNRQGYHHGDLKAALLAAADRLLDEGGTGAVSLREAARLAGASPAACYRHYASKEDLLAALATRGFDQFTEAMEATAAAARAEGNPLTEMAVVYVSFAVERPARFRLMFGPAIADRSAYPALSQSAGRAFATLRDSFPERPDRPGWADDAAVSAWALVHGLATLVVDGMLPRDDLPGLVRSAIGARVDWGILYSPSPAPGEGGDPRSEEGEGRSRISGFSANDPHPVASQPPSPGAGEG